MPSPLHTDGSDEQLWALDNTQERSWWERAATALDDESEDTNDKLTKPDDRTAHPDPSCSSTTDHPQAHHNAAVTTIGSPQRLSRTATDTEIGRDASASPQPRQLTLRTSSDENLWKEFPSDGVDGEVEEEKAVEAILSDYESDEEALEPPLTQNSFDFSATHSRNTSMTSIASMSTGSTHPRKRTLDEMDPPSIQSLPTSPSKTRRTSAQERASGYARTISHDTGLPSHGLPLLPRPVFLSKDERRSVEQAAASGSIKKPPCGWEECKSCTDKQSHEAHINHADHQEPLCEDKQTTYIIAHDQRVQELMDKHELAWGVQYEIARTVNNGQYEWDNITEDMIQGLRGSNCEAAHKVRSTLRDKAGKDFSIGSALWKELDREEAAILEDKQRGLGLQGEWHHESNWYGGKIQQVARLVVSDDKTEGSAPPRIVLGKMQMSRSHRFARYLGSRRILQLKLPKNCGSRYRAFMEQKFVLCGRVFVPFSNKDGNTYLLEVNEDYERSHLLPSDQFRVTLAAFVSWHNPIKFNQNQPVKKWATRFDLGLSTSVPAIRFEPENIFIINDIYAEHEGEALTEHILTDGCGMINGSALIAIAQHLQLPDRPTAVQGRIYGAKGLWVLNPDDAIFGGPPRIWIRHSQLKIKFGDPSGTALPNLSPAHYIFDLVAPSSTSSPARLSKHTIINLAHGGVPAGVFASLMKDSLEAELLPFMQWEGRNAMAQLWNTVNKATGTTMALMQEASSGLQRALGISRGRETEHEDVDESGVTAWETDSEIPESARYLPGGKPISGGELCMRLLQVGFKPQDEKFLYDELRKVIRNKADKDIKKYHITLPNSLEALLAADPYGLLQENEIAFTSSTPILGLEARNRFSIEGDVLIYRNPARVASDVRKVTAVIKEIYAKFPDVILLPTTGRVSLASLLAGGDLDGDTAVLIYESAIVTSFENSPITKQSPDTLLQFEPEDKIQRVAAVSEVLNRSSPSQACLTLQKCLLSGLSDSRVGLYSRFHELAIFMHGYDHPETRRLAHIFEQELDSRKTGRRLKEEVFTNDSRKYNYDLPDCMNSDEPTDLEPSNTAHRPTNLGPFVLDTILAKGKKAMDDLLTRYDNLQKPDNIRHHEMIEPYISAAELSDCASELRAVEGHVKKYHDEWCKISQEVDARTKKSKKKSGRVRDSPLTIRSKILRQLASDFARGPEQETPSLRKLHLLDTVSAAYAYSLRPIFAFNVAFRFLCSIKARDRQPVVFTQDFAAYMSMPSSAIRLLSQGAAEDEEDDHEHWSDPFHNRTKDWL